MLYIENCATVWRGKADKLEEGVAERSSLKRPLSAPFLLRTNTIYKLNVQSFGYVTKFFQLLFSISAKAFCL